MKKTILALGADIKNRLLIARGKKFHFGPELGDLSRAENYELFRKEALRAAKRTKPDIIACDLHPHYFSSLFAKEYSLISASCSLLPIQHHHAHIASVMQEHDLKNPLIGVSFDGTGYGEDGNFWGGEFLLVTKKGFERLAYLKYRMMPGGDRVVYEPWRMVLSILGEEPIPFLNDIRKKDKELVLTMMAKNINSPLTSSAGRLFDAAAAFLGVCRYASFEAEGPIRLEAMCERKINERYKFELMKRNEHFLIDTDGLFLGMWEDLKRGKDRHLIATKFHNSKAEIIATVARKLSKSFGVKDIALSGGVFQNKFLKRKVIEKLAEGKLKVFTNIKTPVNDLNISLGQYYVSCNSSKS